MQVPESVNRRCFVAAVLVVSLFFAAQQTGFSREPPIIGATTRQSIEYQVDVPGFAGQPVRLYRGQVVEVSAGVQDPHQLPDNTRLRISWELVQADRPVRPAPEADDPDLPRKLDAFGIYTPPTTDWSKLLHALDPDIYLMYRAPVAGVYRLNIAPESGDVQLFAGSRWREPGNVTKLAPFPAAVAWPDDAKIAIHLSIRPVDLKADPELPLYVEMEPNDTPEQAQLIPLPAASDDGTVHVVGGSDDIEYFDNGRVGSSGDDWFRLEFGGAQRKLLTACLSIPDQQVAARIRCYRIDKEKGATHVELGQLLSIMEYVEGKNPNERAHQQDEQHRITINRWVDPGGVYLLRVEANSPGYELELRVVSPAPFQDPKRAIRHGIYDHIGQVTAWLVNRPRGASVERRIRDTGNLLGTNCMSCHTQSGVWGPAVPFAHGYRPQNVQPWRQLINICYQSMRPTNHLKDAANNTSLAPLDRGDGPAGTRVAGHAVVALERYRSPNRLQSKQAIRAANYVLQSTDPSGINAAGPGANVGQGVVFNYAGEILESAWRATDDPKFFHGMEDKARKMLNINVAYTDDLGHRVEFFRRFFPDNYVATAEQVARQEALDDDNLAEVVKKAVELNQQINVKIQKDLSRLRDIQLEDGSWGFDPGVATDDGQGWKVKDTKSDPSPTAMALIAFHAAGKSAEDQAVKRGIKALLAMQHPTGYWNGASKTGFVSTSYAVHALARYFPVEPPTWKIQRFLPVDDETLRSTIRRVRAMSVLEDERLAGLMIESAGHDSPLVRYWAMIGLGAIHSDAGMTTLMKGLGDRVKMVREAAQWGMRQTLIDDRGWGPLQVALRNGDDRTRAAAMRALAMRVDGVLPEISIKWDRLAALLDSGLNDDSHPAVRAWAAKAAWRWWIWNPPMRPALNRAWVRLIGRDEPNLLVENTIRYQSHALLIANGHVANGSDEHQYKELVALIRDMHVARRQATEQDPSQERRMAQRLTGVAATFFNQRGGDGGPGQMGYITDGAGKLFGEAILSHLQHVESLEHDARRDDLLRITLEGAANNPHNGLQEVLVDYSINGPEQFRSLAAASISDSRRVTLVAVPEQLEPMYGQLLRGALEPPRRKMLSDPILQMFRGVRWNLPATREQRQQIIPFLQPELSAYRTAGQIEAIEDITVRQQAERSADAVWYLANGLGNAVGHNDDLHFDVLAESLPDQFETAAAARYWLPSIPWILTFKTELPQVRVDSDQLPPIDPYEELRSRALRLFLSQLTPDADGRNRSLAIQEANETALRRNPEVLNTLEHVVEFEKNDKLLETIKKVLSQDREAFQKSLVAAVKAEEDQPFPVGDDGIPQLPADFLEDIAYFRDYVIPEMIRVLRTDQRSCMICHGEPGRVPSMELHRPDEVGYLPIDQLLANYRILQKRIDLENVERSKLLRKPLNVQSGDDDGHQGGRRYQLNDPGYQILRRWALNQIPLQQKYAGAAN